MAEGQPESARLARYLADPRKGLWAMAVPMMLGMSLQTVYMIVDMIFVGRVSAEALTALAFNMPLVFLGMGVTFGLGSGVTAVVARFIGARDKTGADSAAEHGVLLGGVVTVGFTLVGLLYGRELLQALGVPDALLPLAWEYFAVIVYGYVFLVMSVFFRSILSGEGNMRTPMIVQGASTLVNIALDPIFIFALGMGVRGAAIATVLSQALAALAFVYLIFFKEHTYVTFSLESFRPSAPVLGSIIRIGAPASFSFVVMALGGGVFNRMVVGYSPAAVAALQVGSRLDHVVMLPMISTSAALVTLVGMFSGAGRLDLVREVVRYSMVRTVLITAVMGAAFFALAPQVISAFSAEASIREYGVGYVRIIAFSYPFVAASMLSGRTLQGLGYGVPVLLLTMMRVVLLSAPLAAASVYWLQRPVEWVWGAMLLGTVVTSVVALGWLRWGLGRAEQGPDEMEERAPGAVQPVAAEETS